MAITHLLLVEFQLFLLDGLRRLPLHLYLDLCLAGKLSLNIDGLKLFDVSKMRIDPPASLLLVPLCNHLLNRLLVVFDLLETYWLPFLLYLPELLLDLPLLEQLLLLELLIKQYE